jgi:hypothetical protein
LTDLEGEPRPGLPGGDSEGCVTGQSEFSNLNHRNSLPLIARLSTTKLRSPSTTYGAWSPRGLGLDTYGIVFL